MRVVALVLMLVLPMQAAALSCLRPSVARTYKQVEAAAETYIIVTGRLTFDRRKLPKGGNNVAPRLTQIPAKLVGKSMSAKGFKVPFDHPITLDVSCFGPWCGGAENGGQVLAFLKREQGQYALGLNPCGGHVFANPKSAMLKQVLRCHKGGACKPK